ncbi:MAG: UbiD family decarboxylase domain-containing protein, partial [Methanobacteriaceae archaeon]
MRDFLKKIEDNFDIIEIEEKVSNKFEAAKILRQYPKDTVILKNVEGSEIPIISGICNTREKIALAIECEVSEITEKIINAMENPKKINEISEIANIESYTSTNADLSKIPILTHYNRDGGPYITAGVIIAKDPETGIPNASIHRMLVLGDDKLTVRLVPRHLYTY